MASFFDEINANKLKSLLLMGLFCLLFLFIIWIFAAILGFGIFAALIIGVPLVLIYAAISYFFGSKLVLKISGAQPADRKQNPYLFDTIEGLATAGQIKMPDVYIINDPSPNAFATGRNKNHASVAVTSGLLSMMNKEELQGVLAHEISHIYNNDIIFMLVAVVFAGVIGLVGALVRNLALFGGIGGGRRGNGEVIVLVAIVIGILAPIFALLLRLAISRRREYLADANGARMIRDPEALASALKKIQAYSQQPKVVPQVMKANDITQSLYFANPLNAKKALTNLLSTHPPIEERINRLEHMH